MMQRSSININAKVKANNFLGEVNFTLIAVATVCATTEMAAESLTKGLGASRLPQIKDDLKLTDD